MPWGRERYFPMCLSAWRAVASPRSPFTLKRGCFCGIIGNNGSGKTTLLRCLTRNHDVEKGMIRIAGKDICSYSFKDLAKQTAFVPQRTELMFDFSAHQIVLMGRQPYQKPLYSDSAEDLKTVEEAMKQTDTWHLRDANARNLSGGEFQRSATWTYTINSR